MEAAEEIKSRLDIADVIGEYLPLKPAGSGSFKTNCPFHHENTPSFFVNRPRQSWHCFGCNIGGDLISFVEKIEGLEFLDALEHLAQKAGVILPKHDPEKQSQRKKLQEINDYAARLMQQVLIQDPEAIIARKYAEKRGLDQLTQDLWRLGYAPRDWNRLEKKFYDKGYSSQDLIQAGIASPSERGGIYFRFRERLMFPISDAMGHVVGFTGRIMTDEKVAKYVNSPETAIYRKSHILFGLDKAKAEIKRQDLAIIVEGNMDAITSHQFKVSNVVASSGTALTQDQLNLLKRFTNNIAIAFDTDAAGLLATLRGLDLARQMDFSIRIIRYDQELAKDPDELIRKDVNLWQEAIRNAKPYMDWVYALAFRQYQPSTPEGKKKIAQFVLNECRFLQHPVERDAWIGKLAKDLDVSPDSMRAALSVTAKQATEPIRLKPTVIAPKDNPVMGDKPSAEQELESRWLATVLLKPELFHELDIEWQSKPHSELYSVLVNSYNSRIPKEADTEVPLDKAEWIPNLEGESRRLADYLAIFADKEFQDQATEALKKEQSVTEARLRDLTLTRKRQRLETQMREAERLGDTERIKALLAQFDQLK